MKLILNGRVPLAGAGGVAILADCVEKLDAMGGARERSGGNLPDAPDCDPRCDAGRHYHLQLPHAREAGANSFSKGATFTC